MAPRNASHRWSFYRAGGVDQVRLETGADLLHLDELDQKLWVALSCPVKGLEFDQRTLELLDADGDGHVRPPEILAAVAWLRDVLRDGKSLLDGRESVPISSLRDDSVAGKGVISAARLVLKSLGKDENGEIGISDASQVAEVFARATHNGDGVVPPATVEDEQARRVAEEISASLGGESDRSGQLGITAAKVAQFFADCAAYDAWHSKGDQDPAAARPFGDATPAAAAAIESVRAKVDDYFGRCRLAAFDARALAALNREETAYLEVAAKDLSITAAEVAHLPLAAIEAEKPLPLAKGLNPAWSSAIEKLRDACAPGKESLSEAEWLELCRKLDAHRAWTASMAGKSVHALGIDRVREILDGKTKKALEAAIAADLAVAPEVEAISQLERLVRYHAHLGRLLNNYVSFTDFYSRRGAIFQTGTLYFDGRALDLCFRVADAAKHAALAAMSKTYLAYVDCTRKGGEKMTVACAFTAGDSDNLFVGRNGIFYDRSGADWDATITKIVDNPISIGQAFWSPYKKVMRWIEESVAKRAAAADEASVGKLQGAATTTGEAAKTGEVKAKPKLDVGVVAALGVAVGGITAAFSGLLGAFFGLGFWMPLGVLALLLAISGPSMLIAWLKLRQRNLGPILDANGWAVNTLTRVNLPLGRSLTDLARIPPGSARSMSDPFAPKKRLWPRLLLALLLLAGIAYGLWRFGVGRKYWPKWVPEPPKREAEATGDAPAQEAPAPAETPATGG